MPRAPTLRKSRRVVPSQAGALRSLRNWSMRMPPFRYVPRVLTAKALRQVGFRAAVSGGLPPEKGVMPHLKRKPFGRGCQFGSYTNSESRVDRPALINDCCQRNALFLLFLTHANDDAGHCAGIVGGDRCADIALGEHLVLESTLDWVAGFHFLRFLVEFALADLGILVNRQRHLIAFLSLLAHLDHGQLVSLDLLDHAAELLSRSNR